jgi:hypothetical protein
MIMPGEALPIAKDAAKHKPNCGSVPVAAPLLGPELACYVGAATRSAPRHTAQGPATERHRLLVGIIICPSKARRSLAISASIGCADHQQHECGVARGQIGPTGQRW